LSKGLRPSSQGSALATPKLLGIISNMGEA
jgi:hypothetical protein